MDNKNKFTNYLKLAIKNNSIDPINEAIFKVYEDNGDVLGMEVTRQSIERKKSNPMSYTYDRLKVEKAKEEVKTFKYIVCSPDSPAALYREQAQIELDFGCGNEWEQILKNRRFFDE